MTELCPCPIEAAEWLRENYNGNYEMFVDPVAIYQEFSRLNAGIKNLESLLETQSRIINVLTNTNG